MTMLDSIFLLKSANSCSLYPDTVFIPYSSENLADCSLCSVPASVLLHGILELLLTSAETANSLEDDLLKTKQLFIVCHFCLGGQGC